MFEFLGFVIWTILSVVHASPISGGQNAQDSTWTFLVSIRHGDQHRCGGVIIGERWVLTAAHCLEKHPHRQSFSVVAGTLIRSAKVNPKSTYKVRDMRAHEEYKRPYDTHDLAIIYTDRPISFGPDVYFLPIPSKKTILNVEDEVRFAGWGKLQDGGKLADSLQEIKLKIYDSDKCKRKYKSITKSDDDPIICAAAGKGKGLCDGDSGGPLVKPLENEDLSEGILVGIAASIIPPCGVHSADMFVDVYEHRNWITSIQNEIKKDQEDYYSYVVSTRV